MITSAVRKQVGVGLRRRHSAVVVARFIPCCARGRLEKAEGQSQRLAQARAELETACINDKTLAALEDALRQLTEAQARRDALAITLTQHHLGKLRIATGGHELPDGVPHPLHDRTRLDLPGLGTLEIDTGGRKSADSAREAFEAAGRNLRAQLDAAGVETIGDARAAHANWQKAEAEATQIASLLTALAPDGIDRLREQVAAQTLSAETGETGAVGEPDAIAELLEKADGEQVQARADLDAARKMLARADNALSATRTTHRLARDAFEAARAALGTEAQHAERTAQAAERLRQATETLRKTSDLHDALANAATDTETLRAELARTEGAVKAVADRMRTLSEQIHGLDGLIRARAEDGIEEKLADIEGRLQSAEARAIRYAHEAAALQRLVRALEDARHAARDAYFEPVKVELLPLLSLLHGEADIRLDDASLLPVALTRQGQEEEIDILSGGTAEQIAILTRLALARLFSRDGRSVSVILDDALIHSDDDRIERMFTALHRVAGNQQILVFTCLQRAFSRLGGTEARFAIEAT